jgi:hypothetical protein
MCRNIKTLYNFDPPATDDEIRASALQFVRKLSGFNTLLAISPWLPGARGQPRAPNPAAEGSVGR